MNRFSKRQQNIINEIYNSKAHITGKVLSLALNVSVRTIQSDIASINNILPLIKSSNKGYTINKNILDSINPQVITEDPNINHSIVKKLFLTDTTYHIEDLADELFISSSVLEKHLKSLNNYIRKFDLSIIRKNSILSIEGSEYNKRLFLNKIISDEINPVFNNIETLGNYFQDINIDKIKSITINSINKYNYYLENIYYNTLIINITIALFRIRISQNASDCFVNVPKTTDSDELLIAREICTQYSLHCYITPSEEDIIYISQLLEGIIKPITSNTSVTPLPEVITEEFINDIKTILANVFSHYMLNINYEDYVYSFARHIDGLLKRINNMQVSDINFADNIKKTCPFIYDVSLSIAQQLNDKFNIKIIDSEIGYISIHIGYLIDMSISSSDKVIVSLLFDDYYHINSRIKSKLLESFNDLIELTIFNTDFPEYIINSNADLIITNKPLNIIGKEVVIVSPFFTIMDHINVDNAIHKCLDRKQKLKRNNMLSSYFSEKLFFKMDGFKNKEDVIRFLGQKVIDYGLYDDSFIDSVLERENLSSTCFFNTFAIPHAMEMNANKTMVCVLTSEDGIVWDDKLIHIVLLLVVQQSDRKNFMELYNGIVQTLANPEK